MRKRLLAEEVEKMEQVLEDCAGKSFNFKVERIEDIVRVSHEDALAFMLDSYVVVKEVPK